MATEKPLTPFQRRMCEAASELIKKSPLVALKWRPEGPVGMSHSEINKVFIVHSKGPSLLGFLTVHIWFDDVDEKKGTFKIRPQIMFAGRSGEPTSTYSGDPAAQIFWGGLGFVYPF